MHNTHVPGQCIVAGESLLLTTVGTPDLLLAVIVDCVLMSGEIAGPQHLNVVLFFFFSKTAMHPTRVLSYKVNVQHSLRGTSFTDS